MIKIKIIAIGKNKDKWLIDGLAHYKKLISRFAKVEFKIIPNLKNKASLSPIEIKKKEANLIIKELSKSPYIALSDNGRKMNSKAFSEWLKKTSETSNSKIHFIIGGAYGFAPEIIEQAQEVISLSSLTFSHQIVRLVLCEQLYRAFSIIQNTPYHK